jgi:hypothetical protein
LRRRCWQRARLRRPRNWDRRRRRNSRRWRIAGWGCHGCSFRRAAAAARKHQTGCKQHQEKQETAQGINTSANNRKRRTREKRTWRNADTHSRPSQGWKISVGTPAVASGQGWSHKTHNYGEALCRLSPNKGIPNNTATTVKKEIQFPISNGLTKCRHLCRTHLPKNVSCQALI